MMCLSCEVRGTDLLLPSLSQMVTLCHVSSSAEAGLYLILPQKETSRTDSPRFTHMLRALNGASKGKVVHELSFSVLNGSADLS